MSLIRVLPKSILLIILITLAAYFLLIFIITKQEKVKAIVEKLIIISFFFIIPGVKVFPFGRIHPNQLYQINKSLPTYVGLIILYIAIIVILHGRFERILQNIILLFKQDFLGIFLVFLLLSTFWSPNPLMTFRYSVVVIGTSTFAFYISRKYNWSDLSKFLCWSTGLLALLSAFLALFVPSIGHHNLYRTGWNGVTNHPLHLANLMAYTALFWLANATYQSKNAKIISLGFAGLALMVMNFANSSGALVSFFVTMIIVVLIPLLRRLNFSQLVIFISSFTVINTLLIFVVVENLENILTVLGKDITFTGRVPLWNGIFTKLEHPFWLGYGFQGFWQPWLEGIHSINSPVYILYKSLGNSHWAVHAHNGFLDIYLSLGLVGLTLFTLSFLLNILRSIVYLISSKHAEAGLPLILLIYLLMSNLTESQILTKYYPHVWFYYVLLTVRLRIDTTKQSLEMAKIKQEL
ncbi:MAG: O-antigen ligase family protein [Symploca sp. SIO2D2]|nr:O-antigen ligase family protein [Symploca sp. SIO2D2]